MAEALQPIYNSAFGIIYEAVSPATAWFHGAFASIGLAVAGTTIYIVRGNEGVQWLLDDFDPSSEVPTEEEEKEEEEAYEKEQKELQAEQKAEERAENILTSRIGAKLALQDFHKDMQKIVKTEVHNAFENVNEKMQQLIHENQRLIQCLLKKQTKQPQLETKKTVFLLTNISSEYKMNHK